MAAQPVQHGGDARQRPPPEPSAPTPSASNAGNGERTTTAGGCCAGGPSPSNCGGAAVSPTVAGGDRPIDGATVVTTAARVAVSEGTEAGGSREARAVPNADGRAGVAILKKKDLLKRTADRRISEPWVQCDRCKGWGHQASCGVCAAGVECLIN